MVVKAVYKNATNDLVVETTLRTIVIPYEKITNSYLSPEDYEQASQSELKDIAQSWLYFYGG
jgi:uncharacterized protein YdaL